jgi:hypothetical protein
MQGKILYGGINKNNLEYNTLPGIAPQFTTLDSRPFVEVGYGIENILRFIRVDFLHRLTYLDRPDSRPFQIKVGAQFKL